MSVAKLCLLVVACSWFYTSRAAVIVGACQSDKHFYPTITAAIAAVPEGGVINVCPGTYAEQLEIDKPLSIHGIGGFTLTFPAGGLSPLQSSGAIGFATYTQLFINNAGGPVSISYMSIQGGNLFVSPFAGGGAPVPGDAMCADGLLGNLTGDYSAIYSLSSSTTVDHVSVAGYSISPVSPGTYPSSFQSPNCGNGFEFHGGEGTVRQSVVSGFGHYGILGATTVDHNTVSSAGGALSVGVVASGNIIDNTVTGTGFYYQGTTGIKGGELVKGNVVQSWADGIQGTTVRHNTLLNNELAISGATEVSDNLIVAPSTYPNPACTPGVVCTDIAPYSNIPSLLPTIGVDLGCGDGSLARNNAIVGLGIGFANVDPERTVPPTNLIANVTTASTNCAP
jgi:hypothetical protein